MLERLHVGGHQAEHRLLLAPVAGAGSVAGISSAASASAAAWAREREQLRAGLAASRKNLRNTSS